MSPTPASLAARLFASDRLPPVATVEDAHKRIRYGLEALAETPVGGGMTPAELLADRPVFAQALAAVERYLALGKWDEPGAVYARVLEASDALGLGAHGVSAAGLGVLHLVTAVERLVADPADLEAACGYAEAAARQAARSGEAGYAEGAVLFVERLQSRVFGVPSVRR